MKKVTVKRRQIVPKSAFAGQQSEDKSLVSLLHFASTVTAGDLDDAGAFQKFKYACGKNKAHCESAAKEIVRGGRAALKPYPEGVVEAYETKRVEAFKAFECVDDEGNPDGAKFAELEDDARKALQRRVDALVEVFPEIKAVTDENDAILDKYLEGDIDLMMHMVPWESIPTKLAGTWMAEIDCMIDGIPEEFDETIDGA